MVEAVFGKERGLDLKEGDWRAGPVAGHRDLSPQGDACLVQISTT